MPACKSASWMARRRYRWVCSGAIRLWWQHCHSVFGPLTITNQNFATSEVDVFDPQTHAFHQPHAGALQQTLLQRVQPIGLPKQCRYFLSRQHDVWAPGRPDPNNLIQPRQARHQHITIEEQ